MNAEWAYVDDPCDRPRLQLKSNYVSTAMTLSRPARNLFGLVHCIPLLISVYITTRVIDAARLLYDISLASNKTLSSIERVKRTCKPEGRWQ